MLERSETQKLRKTITRELKELDRNMKENTDRESIERYLHDNQLHLINRLLSLCEILERRVKELEDRL
jgi:diphthamide biosynthesis methyltransferase